jgi:hypothetical protein
MVLAGLKKGQLAFPAFDGLCRAVCVTFDSLNLANDNTKI